MSNDNNIPYIVRSLVSNSYPNIRFETKDFTSASEAIAYVNRLGVEIFEQDLDYPSCYDAFLSNGTVVAIQPKNFKLIIDNPS
jgi:hypothetical protein